MKTHNIINSISTTELTNLCSISFNKGYFQPAPPPPLPNVATLEDYDYDDDDMNL